MQLFTTVMMQEALYYYSFTTYRVQQSGSRNKKDI